MAELTLPAPAKLNLFLHILSKRPDNYHEIQTIFQFIDYCDHLNFSLRADGKIHLTSNTDIPVTNNMIWRAAHLIKQTSRCPLGVDIQLTKHLPIGAGVGGGSSNAATTLIALNRLWELQYDESELLRLAVSLGADVAVFVKGQAAWGEGVGERLTPIELPEPWYVLIIPNCQVSTAQLFHDERLIWSGPITLEHYYKGHCRNDFECIAGQDYPQINKALNWLQQFTDAKMTGTGSAIFGAFDTQVEASTIAAQVPAPLRGIVARACNQSPLQVALSCTV